MLLKEEALLAHQARSAERMQIEQERREQRGHECVRLVEKLVGRPVVAELRPSGLALADIEGVLFGLEREDGQDSLIVVSECPQCLTEFVIVHWLHDIADIGGAVHKAAATGCGYCHQLSVTQHVAGDAGGDDGEDLVGE